jgi:hypothetical protein
MFLWETIQDMSVDSGSINEAKNITSLNDHSCPQYKILYLY